MKFLHMTIQTDKFEDEVRFYEEQVGLKVQKDMRPMGRNMVFLADAENDTEIEIIENPDAKDAGNANVSIGFQTEDVEAKRKQMDEAGFKVSPMVSPMPGVKFFLRRIRPGYLSSLCKRWMFINFGGAGYDS